VLPFKPYHFFCPFVFTAFFYILFGVGLFRLNKNASQDMKGNRCTQKFKLDHCPHENINIWLFCFETYFIIIIIFCAKVKTFLGVYNLTYSNMDKPHSGLMKQIS